MNVQEHYNKRDFRIELTDDYDTPAAVVERKIRSLRQLYAVIFLLRSGKASGIPKGLGYSDDLDLEAKFLAPDDQLRFSAMGSGSIYATLAGISALAKESVIDLVGMLTVPGYQRAQDRWTNKTAAERLELEKKRLEVEKQNVDVLKHKVKSAIEVLGMIEKVKNPEAQELLREIATRSMRDLNVNIPEITNEAEQSEEERTDRPPRP